MSSNGGPEFEPGSEQGRALAAFAQHAASTVKSNLVPLEILGSLLFLATQTVEEPEKVGRYLSEASLMLRKLGESHAELMRAYPTYFDGRAQSAE